MYFRESHFGRIANWVPQFSAPLGDDDPAPAAIPRVSKVRFNNSGSTNPRNCCWPTCPSDLGLGVNGSWFNGMEIEFVIAGHSPGFEYAINRTRRSSTWEREGGRWNKLVREPTGTPANPDNQDLCLTPVGNSIFVVAWSGLDKVPASKGRLIVGPNRETSSLEARDIVLRASFTDWVIARNKSKSIGWTIVSPKPFFSWHSVTWLTRDKQGKWVLDKSRSRITGGPLREDLDSEPTP
jgi:hypothetical protein